MKQILVVFTLTQQTVLIKLRVISHCSLFTNHVLEQFYLTDFHQLEHNKIRELKLMVQKEIKYFFKIINISGFTF